MSSIWREIDESSLAELWVCLDGVAEVFAD